MINQPLADRIRPKDFAHFYGQNSIIQSDSFLVNAISNDQLPSIILWGPPGTGKTTLANIIAHQTKAQFFQLSAVSSGKKDLLNIISSAKKLIDLKQKSILFIDEVHRWNKTQQDALLPWIENGTITLIGATTENPSFSLVSALLSRCQVLTLNKLGDQDIKKIIQNAIIDKDNGLGGKKLEIDSESLDFLSQISNGDARLALNTLEACSNQNNHIDNQLIKKILQKTFLKYDKNGEEHYNIISALHKSMRGNDPHASIYWLARMIEAGEDPLYIARRLIRFASEDIGLADKYAILLANTTYDICQKIGLPECNTALTQCVIYLSRAKKSILCYQAYNQAKNDTQQFGNLPVPLHLRNAPTKLMKELKYGKGYKYTPLENSLDQTYFPPELENRKYF